MKHDIELELRKAARRSEMSMLALAREADIGYAAVHGFLTGDRRISLRSAAKLARVLNLELKPRPRPVNRKGR